MISRLKQCSFFTPAKTTFPTFNFSTENRNLSMFLRHIEMESEEKREKSVRKLKKNLKLLMIALVVLAIEKMSEFFTALFSGSAAPSNSECFCNATSH